MFYCLSIMMTRLINRFKLIPVANHQTDNYENPFFAEFPVNGVACPENNFGFGLFGTSSQRRFRATN